VLEDCYGNRFSWYAAVKQLFSNVEVTYFTLKKPFYQVMPKCRIPSGWVFFVIHSVKWLLLL